MTLALRLADFLLSVRHVDERPRQGAQAAIMDLVAAALAGFDEHGTEATRATIRSTWMGDQATVWFTGERSSLAGAALANATSASMLDLDDGHRAAAGHPGAAVIPAVFAAAPSLDASSEDILTAVVLGYEIAVRVAAARDFAKLTTLVSGPWVGFGAAAALAWLRRLDVEKTAQALAIAGTMAPNLAAISYSRVMGNHVKEGIPWATATAMIAVDLAAQGFSGPIDLLDHPALFDSGRLIYNLGSDWAINGIYFKPYGCCRWAHAAIDAVLALQVEHAVSASRVRSIEIDTFSWALRLNNEVAPRSTESAQYSVPFCVAMALVKGADALLRITEADLSDLDTLDLARRVTLRVDPAFESSFPKAVPARVHLQTEDSYYVREVLAPLGEPSNPMDWATLERKFRTIAGNLIEAGSRDLFVAAFCELRAGNVHPLFETLQRPIRRLSVRAPNMAASRPLPASSFAQRRDTAI